ncbi:ABC transporter ATP-binding protein [Sphingomonas sp.]|uniref:ABC transporter ATP-binding protein n=1 Tax=Sphingomonas sp. TaxID=28214 RepID=UPI001B27F230|nr:ABC transporter ATP-binding protein [Sphingomonas sp.]MBO9711673.1 ABC transporter ATP-binding protein [Sphingomonas sp.]
MSSAPASVRASGLAKTYWATGGAIAALDGIDLAIEPGAFVAVVGPSGCGKSSLLSILAGLQPASTGTVEIDGAAVAGPHPKMGMIFQSDCLLPWRTVLQNVLLPFEVRRTDPRAHEPAARALLAQVGLAGFEARRPDELSGGMRQRVAICRALIQEPGLLLMDEPFGALDALTREQMTTDLQALWLRIRNTVVFITHGIDEAVFLADRVLVMSPRPGRIALDLAIDLPRPRRWSEMIEAPAFRRAVRDIRAAFEAQGVLVAG